MVKPSWRISGSVASHRRSAAEVKLDVGGDEIRARSDKRAAVAEAGRQRSAALALEQREVLGRRRGAQAWLVGQPHDRHEWMVLEVLADRQVDSPLDA